MKKIYLLLLIGIIAAGCSKKPEVVTTEAGLKYLDNKIGSGHKVENGDFVKFHFDAWIVKDSTDLFGDWKKDSTKKAFSLGGSKDIDRPIRMFIGKGQFIRGSEDGIIGMMPGGIRTMVIPSKMAYGEKGLGPVPPNTDIKIVVELLKAFKPVKVSKWEIDSSKIITTKSGLKYVIVKEGSGVKPDSGSTITVNYSGYLEDGKLFDSSVERDEPFTFKLKVNRVIKGWEEALTYFNKGTKAQIIVPPYLGYGDENVGPIPAHSTLIFDIEVTDVK